MKIMFSFEKVTKKFTAELNSAYLHLPIAFDDVFDDEFVLVG